MPAAIAASALRRGAVIAYPTEGVWGLGCDPSDRDAVLRLLDIKQRDPAKGLILIAAARAQLDPFVDFDALPASRMAALDASWPGPHTWIVPARAGVGSELRGAHAGLAVRVSAHAEVIALCTAFGGALVSTSANRAGRPAAARHGELDGQLLARIDGVLEGETGGAHGPSSIRDARSGRLLRAAAGG
ncbi:L-threonylcarbamoyladenylate synthase [Luteimonas sp. e5]